MQGLTVLTPMVVAGSPVLGEYVPVAPLITKSGALASLAGMFGEAVTKPTPLTKPPKNFQLVSSSLSVSLAVQLGLGNIFSGTVGASEKAFYFDGMVFRDEPDEGEYAGKVIVATRWAYGLRVLLRVTEISANASLNFGLVGAAVELKQASAYYEILGYGLGEAGLIAALQGLPPLGTFTYDFYIKLTTAVVPRLGDYMQQHAGSLEAEPVGVRLAAPIDPLGSARATYYAMRCLSERRALGQAVARASMELNRDTIRNLYSQVAGITNEAERPSPDAASTAEKWLNV